MTPRTLLRVAALALVTTIVLAGCGNAGEGALHPAAATVDGQTITDAEVARNVKVFTFLSSLNQQPCGVKADGETEQAACARFAIGSLIQEHLVDAYAAQHDLTVTQADKDAILTQLERSVGGPQAVDDQLKTAGIGRADLDELAGRILLFQKVQQAVGAEQADDAALRAQYEKNILSFTTVDTEHILLKTQAQANDAYDRVTAPGATEQDFLDLAKEISVDPSAKDNSGAIGPSTSPPLDPAYAAAAAALKPGEISRPVQSQFGWHVIRLVSKTVQSFADAKGTLAQQQGTQAFDTWLIDAVTAAQVSVNPKYGRFNAETGTVDAVSTTATGSPASATPPPSS
ncbi:MAG: peptidylprolyl isomerase [Actinobacteria bacterium]|nr:peptidylprolyl isomerase [Actinomycetota bacterium]